MDGFTYSIKHCISKIPTVKIMDGFYTVQAKTLYEKCCRRLKTCFVNTHPNKYKTKIHSTGTYFCISFRKILALFLEHDFEVHVCLSFGFKRNILNNFQFSGFLQRQSAQFKLGHCTCSSWHLRETIWWFFCRGYNYTTRLTVQIY